ncbi:PAS domain S-box-containing protein/diguanylate cyclase (GGDEF)-like protein [Hydrogenispora ethanolica]|uniref:PAS domain S-box-containing protein/diguanylate cyclase (GGDEF)-like protein n=2 Tax=Hydrogenispora ethanolica TaxID=1082276 RepID=A0A4R1RXX1_HYDET|nr:PAS domain S-box-containing protein/diguanylate cyclase (GGDEF)-like protein [Hydrogenispora ethanolica]
MLRGMNPKNQSCRWMLAILLFIAGSGSYLVLLRTLKGNAGGIWNSWLIAALVCLALGLAALSLSNRELRKRLSNVEKLSNSAIDAAEIIIIQFDRDGRIVDLNQFAEMKLKYEKSALVGVKSIADLIGGDILARITAALQSGSLDRTIHNYEFPLRGRSGQVINALWNIHWVRGGLNTPDCIEIMGLDITERAESERRLLENHRELIRLYKDLAHSKQKLDQQYNELRITQEQLAVSEERSRLAQEGSKVIVWDWDIVAKHLYLPPAFCAALGRELAEINADIQSFLEQVIHSDDRQRFDELYRINLHRKKPEIYFESRVRLRDGNYKWFLVRGGAVRNERRRFVRLTGTLTDITERKTQEDIIHRLAYYDLLTGLPNRTMLLERLTLAVHKLQDPPGEMAIVFIDIDNFKNINDSYGHSVGDQLLVEVGRRILSALDREYLVARLGGDEFVVLLEDLQDGLSVQRCADRIMAQFGNFFKIGRHSFFVTVSMGIAVFPDHADSAEQLLKNADIAMYQAKAAGKRSYFLYNHAMNERILEQTTLENGLRQALQNQEFFLEYQPQTDLRTNRISGFEALIRWRRPEYGVMPPLKFIRIAEESGLIHEIGIWVLENVCQFIKTLHRAGLRHFLVSLNVSAVQLRRENFAGAVREIIAREGILPENICIEITETVLMESLEENIEKLKTLADLGITVCLDDFGTGYSSLNYLKQLPIQIVKIDRSFIADISADNTSSQLVASIIELAHKIGLTVVAEGVETEEQLASLGRHQCDIAQGFLLGRPLPEQTAREIAAANLA